ncbi:hypothetical protein LCGC14_0826970 [marine sediment metagenome]|uniref:Uncharacterized protein n=1 Tax=marine sediment metagenome TaxID=412755 RepID=A0A0F9SPF1_9ZZZZ
MPHKFGLEEHEANVRKILNPPRASGGRLSDSIANVIKNRASGRVNGTRNTFTRRT